MNDDSPSAIVQEADSAERVVVSKIRVPGRTAFVIVGATRNGGGAGLLAQGARQLLWAGKLPPGSARQRGREDALVKARLLAITQLEVIFEPWSARPENPDALVDMESPAMARSLRVHGGRVVVTDVPWPRAQAESRESPGRAPFIETFEAQQTSLEARGLGIAEALAEDAIEIQRVDLVRALEKARQRIDRRRGAIAEDLAKIAQADRIAAQAQWLVSEATRAPRGATKLIVTDWSSGEAVPMEVPLDPSKSAREQVDAMFKRAKRLKLGGRIAAERLAQADAHARAVADAIDTVRAAPSLAIMETAARAAKKSAPRDVVLPGTGGGAGPAQGRPRAGAKPARIAFRTFVSRTGKKILVGKGAADNDTLTLKVAKPHDLWLHAKDRTGAHVIVPLAKGQTCPAEELVDAAHLAAHFSEARDEKAVDVQYTPKRYLRKPKGSAVGAVVVDCEKVIALRFDATLLRELLEREEV